MSNDKPAERQRFEEWYATHATRYFRDPIGSRDCALQWEAWYAALQAHAAEAAQTMTPSELADRIARGEKWRLADETPQPAQDAKLPSDEDFRLHLGELTPAELRVAQAAFRYAMAKESGR